MADPVVFSRRAFMERGVALVSAGATVPLFLDRTAWAMADPLDVKLVKSVPGIPDDRILVVVQLAGGNDGLNTVVPYRNDRYYEARPRLGIKKDEGLKIDDDLALHPSAVGLKQLYDDGLLGIVQGVGYPNPNRSHFVSTDIWSSATPGQSIRDGWIGRYFDCTCSGKDRPDPKLGIALTRESPLAMAGRRFSPVSFESPNELSWRSPKSKGIAQKTFHALNSNPDNRAAPSESPSNSKSALAYLQRVAMDAMTGAREIQDAAGTGGGGRPGRRGGQRQPGNRGRSQLSRQLDMVKRMIASGLETRVYYVSQGGFDTHAGQSGRHANLLRQFSDALAGFVNDLKRDGLLDKVVVMTFSEFGRRVVENASGGTDHGAAAPLFIAGSRIKPGVHSSHPSLEPDKLDRGDLAWNTDFRSVYSGILSGWMKADAAKILGGDFGGLKLIR